MKKPNLFINDVNIVWISTAHKYKVWEGEFHQPDNSWGHNEAAQLLRDVVIKIANYERNLNKRPGGIPKTRTAPVSFSQFYLLLLSSHAQRIEKEGKYWLIPELYKVAMEWRVRDPDTIWLCLFVNRLHFILGPDNAVLFGTRSGSVAWRPLANPATTQKEAESLMERYSVDTDISLLDDSDIDLIPDPSTDESAALTNCRLPPLTSMEPLASILSQAYYNQRYWPHPHGNNVTFKQGISGINSMVLKIKPSLTDPNYYDFFARIRMDDGDVFMALQGELGSGAAEYVPDLYGSEAPMFLRLLMVQTYHDIVTAREIRTGNKDSDQAEAAKHGLSEQFSRYIPRVYIVGESDGTARIPMQTPREMEPHFVSPHPRRGNMSERQLEVIRKFEQETGFKVLSRLRPGQTWVSPHVSPTGEAAAEVLTKLPKFVRSKIQRDLDRKLAQFQDSLPSD